MRFAATVVVATSIIALASPAEAQRNHRREREYLALSQEDFATSMTVVDDALNPDIRINSREGYRDYQFSFGPRNDQFLRGSLVRASGTLVLQGYVTNEVNASSALQPVSITFEHSLGTRPVDRVALDVRSCGRRGCLYYEEMVFDFRLEELDALIAQTAAQEAPFVRFRVQGQSGLQRDGRYHLSELRAFRAALEPFIPEEIN